MDNIFFLIFLLFFLASIGGGVGVYAGMFVLRHKTRKWYFILGIPLLIAQNGICFLWVSEFLKSF